MRWYTDPNFRSRVLPPPQIQKLDVPVRMDDGSTRILREKARAKSGLLEADIEQEENA